MPRALRIRSASGIYHVMFRGINRQQIFEDEEDNLVYLHTLKEYKQKCGYKIFAYCLMGNHVHLLIKEGEEPLGQVFKRIGARYVYWYNTKYKRVGHLFQDRFKSEAVENIPYLYTVISYIHQNPVKAGICKYPEEYLYSSFPEYLGQPDLVDIDHLEQYISRETAIELSRKQMDEECMEMTDSPMFRVTDQQAKQIMEKVTGCGNVAAFQSLDYEERNKGIRILKGSGLSLRQISRLTGVSYYVVQKTKVNQRTVP